MGRPRKIQRVLDYIATRGWGVVGELEWRELKAAVPDISESTIRSSGIVIAQPWLGVRQHNMDELEACLRELGEVYASRPDLRRYCRDQVIGAKTRARFVASSERVEESKRRLKAEMVEWMLVWLDDPAMFPAWAAMRRGQMAQGCSTGQASSG
ncbi:MAG TPA: hypothetical protein VK789_18170 [Bryobacteraceae bacterium]|nr:hypothetical protein [Bryobacteraceae bacterium]